ELRRLKEVVDLAADSPLPVLYLFDEILLGTNAEERRVAVQKVLSRLKALGAVGAVATHDLSLATAEGLADACVPVHFTERFDERNGRAEMSFDYRVRPGLAPTTNALKLLALVGLGDDPPG
ncbi:MAG: DNA mismatch repair protein MutS, partial [Myxococcota bacterium]|nr:DNA mismatch repair protein MutS [Myxococcota bacterium]